jgi:hypothetical protein
VEALESAGFTPARRRFVKVDAAGLDPTRTVLFLNSTDREHRYDSGQWKWLDARVDLRHVRLPQATRDYYVACAHEGTQPLLFAYVPHVLFRGSLDISRLSVTEV